MLGILEDSINIKWNVVNVEDKLSIRNFLISILLKCVNEQGQTNNSSNNHFINKLNNVIVLVIIFFIKINFLVKHTDLFFKIKI